MYGSMMAAVAVSAARRAREGDERGGPQRIPQCIVTQRDDDAQLHVNITSP